MNNGLIHEVKPNPLVEIQLPDGRVFSGPRGTTVETFLKALPEWEKKPLMGAVVNGELRELTFPIEIESHVQPLTMVDDDGARIYRRSLTFILEAAFEDLFPDHYLSVDHAVSSGGFFCEVENHEPLTPEEIQKLESHMREIVKADKKFIRKKVPLQEAIEYFAKKGQTDKTGLLKYRTKDYLILYALDDHFDYFHGYMVPSTGYLRWFELIPVEGGFILHFTRRHRPTELQPITYSHRLLSTFRQYGNWLSRLGIENVGALNDSIANGKIREVVLVSEALHEQRISDIAHQILNRNPRPQVVLISGPSSSGKTTFSKRLSVQLLAQGISPFPFEMDNYFVDREETPRDENGQYDFEALDALNIPLLTDHLKRLINNEEVELRRYNFRAGKNEPGDVVQLKKDQMIIIEGIHGLNPALLPKFPMELAYRIYVSCLTQLNLDRYNRIATTDTRLLRRTVRDARERGYSAQQTFQQWSSVRLGEMRHIFPYQDNADEIFNSALAYDLSALKPFAEPLLRQVPFGTPEYIEAKRLLAFLDWFLPLDIELIPDNSILREFLGKSILQDFKLW
jgi:uridine kinase